MKYIITLLTLFAASLAQANYNTPDTPSDPFDDWLGYYITAGGGGSYLYYHEDRHMDWDGDGYNNMAEWFFGRPQGIDGTYVAPFQAVNFNDIEDAAYDKVNITGGVNVEPFKYSANLTGHLIHEVWWNTTMQLYRETNPKYGKVTKYAQTGVSTIPLKINGFDGRDPREAPRVHWGFPRVHWGEVKREPAGDDVAYIPYNHNVWWQHASIEPVFAYEIDMDYQSFLTFSQSYETSGNPTWAKWLYSPPHALGRVFLGAQACDGVSIAVNPEWRMWAANSPIPVNSKRGPKRRSYDHWDMPNYSASNAPPLDYCDRHVWRIKFKREGTGEGEFDYTYWNRPKWGYRDVHGNPAKGRPGYRLKYIDFQTFVADVKPKPSDYDEDFSSFPYHHRDPYDVAPWFQIP